MDDHLTIERTKDRALIGKVMTHPDVVAMAMDEGNLAFDQIDDSIFTNDSAYFFIGRDQHDEIVGLVHFYRHNGVTVQGHVSLLPKFRGLGMGKEIVSMAVDWVRKNLPWCHKVIVEIPEDNAIAIAMVNSVGFVSEGANLCSFKRGDTLIDQIWFGLRIPR